MFCKLSVLGSQSGRRSCFATRTLFVSFCFAKYHNPVSPQMRYTKKVSVWPVGLSGGLKWEGPICKNGSIVKFYTAWKPERPLPVDMAGFAINVDLLMKKRRVVMDPLAARGLLESSIVSPLVTTRELEALADDCTKVFRSILALKKSCSGLRGLPCYFLEL